MWEKFSHSLFVSIIKFHLAILIAFYSKILYYFNCISFLYFNKHTLVNTHSFTHTYIHSHTSMHTRSRIRKCEHSHSISFLKFNTLVSTLSFTHTYMHSRTSMHSFAPTQMRTHPYMPMHATAHSHARAPDMRMYTLNHLCMYGTNVSLCMDSIWATLGNLP